MERSRFFSSWSALAEMSRRTVSDGALDGLADGLEGNLHAAAQGVGDVARSGVLLVLCVAEALSDAAEDLAGDDARVAAGAHERPVRDRLGDVVDRGVGGQRLDLAHDGAKREGHVRSGVPVRNREHVELVNLLGAVGNDLGRDREARADDVRNHVLGPRFCVRGA